MNEEQKLNVDEVKQEPKKKKSPPKKKKNFEERIGWLALLLAVVVVVGAGFTAYRFVQIHFQVSDLQNQNMLLSDQLQADHQLFLQQNKNINDNKVAVEQLLQETGNNKMGWELAKSGRMIYMADLTLRFDHDIPTTILLLQKADSNLSKLDDSKLLNLRKTLTADIATLRAIPKIDVAGIYLQLQALNGQVDKAKSLVSDTAFKKKQAEVTQQQTQHSAWVNALLASWQSIQKVLIIQHRKQPFQPMLTSQQRDLLNINIAVLFSQAQRALLQQQSKIYQASLQKIQNLMQKYFSPGDSTTQHILTELAKLQKIDIAPELPDISDSLRAIKQIKQSQSQQLIDEEGASSGKEK